MKAGRGMPAFSFYYLFLLLFGIYKIYQVLLQFIYSVPSVIRWFIWFVYLIAIAFASLMPSNELPHIFYFQNIDKVVHFTMYFGFSLLGLWTFDKAKVINGKLQNTRNKHFKIYFIVFLMAVVLGFSIEVFQRLMPFGRMYSLYDMYANITGALIGAGLYFFLFSLRRSH
ncbi:MAG: VanZ family protein [Chloroflexota bacterium]